MFNIFKKKNDKNELTAYLDGEVISIEEVNDEMFSKKMLGEGLAIIPNSSTLISPCDGKIIVMMKDTGHACGIQLDNGMEILLHIGLDTVNMNHDGFEELVTIGSKVSKGTPLIAFDREKIKKAGYSDITMMVITNPGNTKKIHLFNGIDAKQNQTVILKYE